jgi:type VI secretion system secreted protein VgrG
VAFAAILGGVAVWAQSSLGTAQSFAVLGGSTVTNTGASVITGDLGVSPGAAVTGFFPPGIVTGTIHSANAVALQAQNDVTTQYNALAGAACLADLTGQDLGGMTLTPGVYCFSSSAQLTGALTLNAQGNANATFIFKTGSTLTTAAGSSVLLINGGNPCGVAWQIGSSATLGTTTAFIGNLIALTSITLNTGANIIGGRALARNGAVTLDTNNISFASCAAGAGPPPLPTLATWAVIVLAALLALAGFAMVRRRETA